MVRKQVCKCKGCFFIGRGIDYAISMEGSLKMKEISYIHSEAYAAGELKHGTISLIEDGILVVGVATQAALFEKTISNMVEVKSRGAYLMGLTTYGNYNIEDTADFAVYVPQTESFFATSLAIVPLQANGLLRAVWQKDWTLISREISQSLLRLNDKFQSDGKGE